MHLLTLAMWASELYHFVSTILVGIAALLGLGAQGFWLIRYFYRKSINEEVYKSFVRDMATNHLPHVYQALQAICNKLEIELDAPPPIAFINMDVMGFDKSETRKKK